MRNPSRRPINLVTFFAIAALLLAACKTSDKPINASSSSTSAIQLDTKNLAEKMIPVAGGAISLKTSGDASIKIVFPQVCLIAQLPQATLNFNGSIRGEGKTVVPLAPLVSSQK